MSINALLKDCVDSDTLQRYLLTLAKQQIQVEKMAVELTERLLVSEKLFEKQQIQIEQINIDLKKAKGELLANKKIIDNTEVTQKQIISEVKQIKRYTKTTEKVIDNFIARSDGTAIDKKTGLMWCRYCVGQEWNYEKQDILGDAQRVYVSNSFLTSFNQQHFFDDWRVPNRDELESIMILNSTSKVNKIVFPKTPNYWFLTATSSSSGGNSFIVLQFGDKEYENGEVYVRLVRG